MKMPTIFFVFIFNYIIFVFIFVGEVTELHANTHIFERCAIYFRR